MVSLINFIMMLAEHINRKKESHYVKVIPTKTGKERYYILKHKDKVNKSKLLQDLPSGFKFYEFPYDARVVIRKIVQSTIDAFEIEIVDDVMKNQEPLLDYIIDKEANNIAIYIANLNLNDFTELKENFHLVQTCNQKLKFEKTGIIF